MNLTHAQRTEVDEVLASYGFNVGIEYKWEDDTIKLKIEQNCTAEILDALDENGIEAEISDDDMAVDVTKVP